MKFEERKKDFNYARHAENITKIYVNLLNHHWKSQNVDAFILTLINMLPS